MAADGIKHPALFSKPALRADCVHLYDAFLLLSACRMVNQVGPQRIQVSEIKAYLDTTGETDPEKRERFVRLMVELDAIEHGHMHSRLSK